MLFSTDIYTNMFSVSSHLVSSMLIVLMLSAFSTNFSTACVKRRAHGTHGLPSMLSNLASVLPGPTHPSSCFGMVAPPHIYYSTSMT